MSDSCDPVDCSLPGSSVCVIFRAGILDWVVIFFSRGSSQPSDQTHVSCLAGGFFTTVPPTSVQSVQSLSCVRLLVLPWTAARQASLSFTNLWSLLKLMSIELVMSFNHLILCCSLLPPSTFPSIRAFSNESVLHISGQSIESFSLSISPSNEYSGLISLRMDGLDLLAVQGTLRSLLQTTIQNHQFFGAQLSL